MRVQRNFVSQRVLQWQYVRGVRLPVSEHMRRGRYGVRGVRRELQRHEWSMLGRAGLGPKLSEGPRRRLDECLLDDLGGAKGADSLAVDAANELGLEVITVLANWQRHGKAAGPMRNTMMLRLDPDLVIAFPGDKGTENMVMQAEEKGTPVERVECSS